VIETGIAGDAGGEKGRRLPHQAGHHEGRQTSYQTNDEAADEADDEFRSRKSLIRAVELATPPPANEGDVEARLAPTPRSQRPDRGVGASLEVGSKGGGRGGQFGRERSSVRGQ
jgi:hypothetical protein